MRQSPTHLLGSGSSSDTAGGQQEGAQGMRQLLIHYVRSILHKALSLRAGVGEKWR